MAFKHVAVCLSGPLAVITMVLIGAKLAPKLPPQSSTTSSPHATRTAAESDAFDPTRTPIENFSAWRLWANSLTPAEINQWIHGGALSKERQDKLVSQLDSAHFDAWIESGKRVLSDARKLQVGDAIDRFMPPLRACVQAGDPKLAAMNQKLREETVELRQKYGLQVTEHQWPSCATLGDKDDPNWETVRSTSYVPGTDIPAGDRVNVCFEVSGKFDVSDPTVDLDEAEREARPLYCAVVPFSVSAKIWKRKDD